MGRGSYWPIQHVNHVHIPLNARRLGFLDPSSRRHRGHHHLRRAVWHLYRRCDRPETGAHFPNLVRFVLDQNQKLPLIHLVSSDVHEVGVWTGTMYGMMGIVTLTSTLAAGALVDGEGGNFLGLKIFCGASIALGCGFLVCARVSLKGWKLKANV